MFFSVLLGVLLKFTSSSKMVNLKLQFPGDSFRDPLYPPILKIAYIAIESVTPIDVFSPSQEGHKLAEL